MRRAKRTTGCDIEGKIYFVYLLCMAVLVIGGFMYFVILN